MKLKRLLTIVSIGISIVALSTALYVKGISRNGGEPAGGTLLVSYGLPINTRVVSYDISTIQSTQVPRLATHYELGNILVSIVFWIVVVTIIDKIAYPPKKILNR